MPWGEIGAVLIVLVVVFVVGNLWFHIVEKGLSGLKRLFFRKEKPAAWHPLPPERKKEEKEDV